MNYQTHLPRFSPVGRIKVSGKPITQPNRSIDIRKAIKEMAFGSLENRMGAFYEEQGVQIPDFRFMDRIEKLQALNHYREDVRALVNKANYIEKTQDNNLIIRKAKKDGESSKITGGPDTGASTPKPTTGGTGV